MAVIAERIVEEWLNRMRYFTIRGVHQGNAEIDLLAVRWKNGQPEAKHVEVNVSTNPVGYLTDLTPQIAHAHGVHPGNAMQRTPEEVLQCVQAWINKKFDARAALRNAVWLGLQWDRVLVHGIMNHEEEQAAFVGCEIALIPIQQVIDDLCGGELETFTTSAAGDLVRLINFLRPDQD